jgi:hypothetical protein
LGPKACKVVVFGILIERIQLIQAPSLRIDGEIAAFNFTIEFKISAVIAGRSDKPAKSIDSVSGIACAIESRICVN